MYIKVLVENRVASNDMLFTYHIDNDLAKDIIGKRVLVPFRTNTVSGFVIDFDSKPLDYEAKEVIKVVDESRVLNDELLELGKKISEKYLCPLVYSYQAMLPKALKAKSKNDFKIKTQSYVKLNDNVDASDIKYKKQLDIINLLKDNESVLKSSIESKSSLKKLILLVINIIYLYLYQI